MRSVSFHVKPQSLAIGVLIWPGVGLMVLPPALLPGGVRFFALLFWLLLLLSAAAVASAAILLRRRRFRSPSARCRWLQWGRVALFQLFSLWAVIVSGERLLSQCPAFPVPLPLPAVEGSPGGKEGKGLRPAGGGRFPVPIRVKATVVSDPGGSGGRFRCRVRFDETDLALCGLEGRGSCRGYGEVTGTFSPLYRGEFLPPKRGDCLSGRLTGKSAWGWQMEVEQTDGSRISRFDRAYRLSRGKLSEWAAAAGESGGLAMALLDGDRSFVDEAIRRGYQKAGVSHLLALSGMHLGVIAACLMHFLVPMVGPMPAYGIVAAVSWLYVWFAGASPSLVRAAWMSLLLLFFKRKGGSSPMKLVLALSFSLSLLLQPHQYHSPSFILSYLALAGLLWLEPLFSAALETLFGRGLRRLLGKRATGLIRALGSVYAAQAATVGWTFPVFGSFASGGLFAGLFLTPLTFALMGVGSASFFAWLLGWKPLSDAAGFLLQLLYRLNSALLHAFGEWPLLTRPLPLFLYFLPMAGCLFVHFVIKWHYASRTSPPSLPRILQLPSGVAGLFGRTRAAHAKAVGAKFSRQSLRSPTPR